MRASQACATQWWSSKHVVQFAKGNANNHLNKKGEVGSHLHSRLAIAYIWYCIVSFGFYSITFVLTGKKKENNLNDACIIVLYVMSLWELLKMQIIQKILCEENAS